MDVGKMSSKLECLVYKASYYIKPDRCGNVSEQPIWCIYSQELFLDGGGKIWLMQ